MPDAASLPQAAVVVPVFNRLDLLRHTIESLRSQTMRHAEFILVDDRSEPDTRQYLASLPREDARFRIVLKHDEAKPGCQASRNIGMDASRAEAIVFLDSDDLLSPTCLEERYATLLADPETDMVVGRQVIFTESPPSQVWVNIPSPAVADLDRFIALGPPIDVPWVNGGVMIRRRSLALAAVRWRSEFHWDDVAFHFECVVAGMRARWLDFAGLPDSFYRKHGGHQYGRKLFTADGLRSTAAMLRWMNASLLAAGKSSEDRRRALVFAFFQTCVLRAVDTGEFDIAMDVTRDAARDGLLCRSDARRMRAFVAGRRAGRWSRRLTYHFNQRMKQIALGDYYSDRGSTHGTIRPALPQTQAFLLESARSGT